MHITVICPSCESRYQVEPSLRGQRMRCPNPVCRHVFEVQEAFPVAESSADAEPVLAGPPAPPVTFSETGTVGEMVPILSAEAIQPAEERIHPLAEDVPLLQAEVVGQVEKPEVVQELSWQQAPPVRKAADPPSEEAEAPPERATESAAATRSAMEDTSEQIAERPTAAPAAEAPGGPVELPPGAWQTPPVRRESETATAPTARTPDAEEMAATAGRRARRVLVGLVLGAVVIVGAAIGITWKLVVKSEDELRAQAQREYEEGRYDSAEGKYRELAERFSESQQVEEYRFLSQLSKLRGLVYRGVQNNDPGVLLDNIDQFRKTHEANPLLKKYNRDLGQTLVKLCKDFAESAQGNPDPAALEFLARAERALDDAQRRDPEEILDAERKTLAQAFAEVRRLVVQRQDRQQLVARLAKLAATPSADTVQQAVELVKQETHRQPGVNKDEQVVELLRQLREGHFRQVRYTPNPPRKKPKPSDEDEPSLPVVPLVDGPLAVAPRNEPVVLALARGVLYALGQHTGKVKWALRVGIDTATLPLRLPATTALPEERILVASADAKTLTAVRAHNGETLWEHAFDAPCLGRPVIVNRRAYVPTYEGQVHEIELVEGNLLGSYNLGQRLTVGGAHQEGTNRVYFPADDSCVYVLDVAQQRCEAILYLDHPSGSLRSEPIVVSWTEHQPDAAPDAGTPQGYLILNQTDGLDALRLRTFSLPLQAPAQSASETELTVVTEAGLGIVRPLMKIEPRVQGWTWFQPHYDNEKLVLVTDAGVLGLFGIRQWRNQDDPLFPYLRVDKENAGTHDLREFLKLPTPRADLARGRAQVVHAAPENDFWVLANGGLLKLHFTRLDRAGPKVVARWPQSLSLGSPLHASQVDETGSILFVVTQSSSGQTCLATAVDGEDGRIRWQRQLGLVCQQEPLVLRHGVLALDQGGGLFSFDPLNPQSGAQSVARSLQEKGRVPPQLVPAGTTTASPSPGPLTSLWVATDASFPANLPWAALYQAAADDVPRPDSAYAIVCPGDGKQLVVRRYQSAPAGQEPMFQEQKIDLKAPLAGTAGVGPNSMIVPLADGSLLRLPLAPSPDGKGPLFATPGGDFGPNWRRGGRAREDVRGHVVWLGGDDFLTTDGNRGLTRWRWPLKGDCRALPDGKNPTVEMPARLVAAPVVLPGGEANNEQVCVADIEGTITLLQGIDLTPTRRWKLAGKITAGPYVQGTFLGCVVDRRRLVWIDPAHEDKPLWEYTTPGEGIVGQPQRVGNLIVVADYAGQFVGLDPATGKPVGKGYTLKASVAPAASPVAFGPGKLFAPLTDGTVLLLSRRLLEQVPDKD